jgi:peptide/nickel transport system substrate-binding protein
LADVSDFYESVAHSRQGQLGSFNGISYSNSALDAQIEAASQSLDEQERRVILEGIAETLLEDRVILPLFEAQLLYGIRPELNWNIRLDGQVLASEISGNMVEY